MCECHEDDGGGEGGGLDCPTSFMTDGGRTSGSLLGGGEGGGLY